MRIFSAIGEAFNSPIETRELLERVAQVVVEQLGLKGCHFLLLSQDQKILEHIGSYGLSQEFLSKGAVDAEKSVTEALAGNTVMITDCATDPRVQYPEAHVREGIASTLTVPLRTRGQVIGIMRLSTAQKREFQDLELQIVEIVATFATRVITRSMFQDILENVTQVTGTSLDPDQVMLRTVEIVCESLRARGCTIHLFERRSNRLRLRAADGLSQRFIAGQLDVLVNSVAADLDGECRQIYDTRSDARIAAAEAITTEGISSLLFVPLVIRDKALGVLGLYTHHPYRFSEDEIYFMKAIAGQCALGIQNAQMYAALKSQYENLMEDFHTWFETQYQ
jgi:GAF domain-containing protein